MKKVSPKGFSVAALALAAGAITMPASAALITVQSVVPQSGYNGLTLAETPLTDPLTPYDFAGTQYSQLTTIDTITVTLSVLDGNTDIGELDFDNWTLGLDGLDTGLKLNGFTGGQNIVTLSINGPSNAAALLTALQSDGQLVGTIIDSDPGDNVIGLPFVLDTSLDISGDDAGGPGPIPLPAAALMGPLGAGLVAMVGRRFRKSPAK